MQEEKWANISWAPNYNISNYGRVYSMNKKDYLCPYVSTPGYLQTTLWVNGKGKHYDIHRLVAEFFVSGYQAGFVPDHIDNNKLNNYYENLQWLSIGDNNRKNHTVNDTRKKKVLCEETGDIYCSIRDAAKSNDVCANSIRFCCEGKFKTCKGLHFKFTE